MLTYAVTGRPANKGDIRCAWPHVRRHSGANGDEEAGKRDGDANKGNPADRRTYRCESADCERTVEIWTRREYSFILQLRFLCKSADCEWTVEFQSASIRSFRSCASSLQSLQFAGSFDRIAQEAPRSRVSIRSA